MPPSPAASLDKAVSIAGALANALLLYARTVALSDNALAIAALVSVRSDVLDRMERLGASASDREAVQDMLDLVAAAIAPEESKQ